MIKLFADTASLDEIKYCFARGVNDGITTNPKIIESTGDLSLGFKEACKRILSAYPDIPVSLETDFGRRNMTYVHQNPRDIGNLLLAQARELASWGDNVIVKIPICYGGLRATEILSKDGIKTNVTACITPYQALEAANAGATYVSLFANRMLDPHILELAEYSPERILKTDKWKDIVKENQQHVEEAWDRTLGQIDFVARKLEGTKSELIVGSIRSPQDMHRISKANPQIITVPYGIVQGLENILILKNQNREVKEAKFNQGSSLIHPMTDYTLEEFERAAESYRNKRST